MLSFSTEKVESLCAVGKVREGSIDTTHVSNCVVEIQIIVHALKRPYRSGIPFTLGLCNGRRADVPIFPAPSEMEIYRMSNIQNMCKIENYKSYNDLHVKQSLGHSHAQVLLELFRGGSRMKNLGLKNLP